MRIAVFTKKQSLRTRKEAVQLVEGLRSNGVEVYDIESAADLLPQTSLLLSLGGDGTFLSAAKRAALQGIPIMGINFGRVGFLSEFDGKEALQSILSQDYSIEDRSMLCTEVISPGGSIREIEGFWPYSLNEVTVHRSSHSVLGIEVTLDSEPLPTYWADGLLVATSSGSTAYSLSVGGPICMPDSRVLIIAPIAPHNLNVRPLIVPETTRVSLGIISREDPAVLTLDNRTFHLMEGDTLRVSLARFSLKKVRSLRSDFVNALRTKLFWGEDKRNSPENN